MEPRCQLRAYAEAEVVRLVRARVAKAKSPLDAPSDDQRLQSLCWYRFGGWRQALRAAGVKVPGVRLPEPVRPPKPTPLTESILRSQRTAADLERLTGVSRHAIRHRRAAAGVARDERRWADRGWVERARELLGKAPDTEVAKRFGVTVNAVAKARASMGIPRFPKPSRTLTEARARLKSLSPAELRRYLATLDPLGRAIVRDRILAERPATLDDIARRFGVSRHAVALRERRLR